MRVAFPLPVAGVTVMLDTHSAHVSHRPVITSPFFSPRCAGETPPVAILLTHEIFVEVYSHLFSLEFYALYFSGR